PIVRPPQQRPDFCSAPLCAGTVQHEVEGVISTGRLRNESSTLACTRGGRVADDLQLAPSAGCDRVAMIFRS
ncbi:MAG: hypothetical protein E6471_17905, partial [Bradyrhizobium sp.]|nr:hypothetical protein [Bradyrhizobium sp.]